MIVFTASMPGRKRRWRDLCADVGEELVHRESLLLLPPPMVGNLTSSTSSSNKMRPRKHIESFTAPENLKIPAEELFKVNMLAFIQFPFVDGPILGPQAVQGI
jgi:hypothetical protein